MSRTIHAADLFCGAGGTSTGLVLAATQLGIALDLLAVNHWQVAVDTHTRNHPSARHLCADLANVDPSKVVPGGRLQLLVASPECTHHSTARGGRPCSDQSRASAWHILHWCERLRVDSVLIENVREFQTWGPLMSNRRPDPRRKGETFRAFLAALESLGYTVEHRVLNAADYGDATTRRRLFIQARRSGPIVWPEPTFRGHWRAAREIIDWGIQGQSISTRRKPLARRTMARIEAGLRRFGGAPFITLLRGPIEEADRHTKSVEEPLPTITAGGTHLGLAEPFVLGQQSGSVPRPVSEPLPTVATKGAIALIEPYLVDYYGQGRPHSIDSPVPTITTHDRFGLVEPQAVGGRVLDIRYRMLQPHELAAAMGFDGYEFAGNKTETVKQIGNAVPVLTAKALCLSALSA